MLKQLVEARQSTLGDRAFVTLSSVAEYGQLTHGTLMKLIMNELWKNAKLDRSQSDVTLRKGFQAAEHMGAAVGIITLLRYASHYLRLVFFNKIHRISVFFS